MQEATMGDHITTRSRLRHSRRCEQEWPSRHISQRIKLPTQSPILSSGPCSMSYKQPHNRVSDIKQRHHNTSDPNTHPNSQHNAPPPTLPYNSWCHWRTVRLHAAHSNTFQRGWLQHWLHWHTWHDQDWLAFEDRWHCCCLSSHAHTWYTSFHPVFRFSPFDFVSCILNSIFAYVWPLDLQDVLFLRQINQCSDCQIWRYLFLNFEISITNKHIYIYI